MSQSNVLFISKRLSLKRCSVSTNASFQVVLAFNRANIYYLLISLVFGWIRFVWLVTVNGVDFRSLETNKQAAGENPPSSPSSARGRSKSRHRLHGAVKSSTSSPTSSPGRTLRTSPGSSVHKCSAKADSRHMQSSSKGDRAESSSGLSSGPTSSGSNQLVGNFASVLRSRNFDDSSDNQTEATSNESGIVCSLDEVRPARSVVRASELCNRRNYDSDDNGNNSATTAVDVRLNSPSYSSVHSLRCKPRRFKRVMSAGQSLEVLTTSDVDDSRLQVPQASSHGRLQKREVIFFSYILRINEYFRRWGTRHSTCAVRRNRQHKLLLWLNGCMAGCSASYNCRLELRRNPVNFLGCVLLFATWNYVFASGRSGNIAVVSSRCFAFTGNCFCCRSNLIVLCRIRRCQAQTNITGK